ncbi:TPA: glycosyltransferase family 4 protein [Pseudomonas aeruginosa]|nr:glycosyltransferase family 4 protein [Pseudomonas aeruginosa]RPS73830.1 glycosyltransferase family 1 protein [Pseudomonas aeruginosa]HBN8469015.1 glycosyltransferase family 4 protein [Pseudomonas aeruginosa]
MRPVLLMVINDPAFFMSHRLPIATGARSSGFDVHIATRPGQAVSRLIAEGFRHHELPLSRSGKNPFSEFYLLLSIWRLLWKLRPDILHLVTIKPVLYGGIAARLAPVKGVVAAVSGLGFVFMAKGSKASVFRSGIAWLYRRALGKKRLRVIFQNPDDRDALIGLGAITYEKSVLIRGSGVDLSLCHPAPESPGTPVVTLAARLLRDKGVVEFVEAANILRQRGVSAHFQLVGDLDPGNPSSIEEFDLERWRSEGTVECLGYRQDIASVFAHSHIVVLPSYREGLPKVLVEAAACGRVVVTTDVPGCRDAIEADRTGLLVPVRDAVALADAIQRLVESPELRKKMGAAGRTLAERDFAIESIVQQHLDIYRALGSGA